MTKFTYIFLAGIKREEEMEAWTNEKCGKSV